MSESEPSSGRVTHTCACGCHAQFEVSSNSRKIYLNTKHSQAARDYRKKLRYCSDDAKEMEIEFASLSSVIKKY